MKEVWADNHAEFMAEIKGEDTSFRVVGYSRVLGKGKALGEHVDVFDEMAVLCTAAEQASKYSANPQVIHKLDKIIYAV